MSHLRVLACLLGLLAAGAPAPGQTVALFPRVFNDVPASQLTMSRVAASVSILDRNVSAPSGFANRHDWRLSPDGTVAASFGPETPFDLSATLSLIGAPESPRKEAGLRVDGPCGDSLFYVDTDAHDVVTWPASGGVLPFYDFRAHGAPAYNSGDTVRLRVQYTAANGVNGFILSANGFSSPFLPAGGAQAGVCAGSTVGGYLQVLNAPTVPSNTGSAAFTAIRTSVAKGPPLTDEELLDRTEAQACMYAYRYSVTTAAAAGFPNGRALVADSSSSGQVCSVAATGFGLVCLAIQAARYGTSPEWTVTPAVARARANAILDTVLEIQAGGTDQAWNGVPYHFMSPGAGGQFRRAWTSEVSSVDGAILVEGVLAAGQGFGGEVRDKALQVAANARWSPFLIPVSGQKRFSMAWRPETGDGFTIPAGGGYLLTANYDRPTDELLVLGLLGVGREPGNRDLLRAVYGYPRATRTYRGGNGVLYPVVCSYFGSLFTYTQAHGLIPFDRLGPDHPEDVAAAVPAVDWWQNSVTAALAARQFSIDHMPTAAPPDAFPVHASFGPDAWGLTAAVNPANTGDYKGLLGAPPREANGGAPEPEGIIAPYAAISALPLLRTSPTEALSDNPAFRALRHYYDDLYGILWGPYGPKESYDDALNVADLYLGIDAPLEGINIEAYRTGRPAAWLSLAPPMADAFAVVHHKGLAPGDLDLSGAVTPADAADALRIGAGLVAPTPAQSYNADVSGDGAVTIADAVSIARTAVAPG